MVLAVLKHRWTEPDPRYSSFEAVFNDNDDRGRRSDPSYYHIHVGKEVQTDLDVLSHAEATLLVAQGVFGPLAKAQTGGMVTINEHAQHAFTDFCSEVYGAWAKYQRRIAEVEKVCPAIGG